MSVWDIVSNTNNAVSIVSIAIAIGSAAWGTFSSKRASTAANTASALLDKLNDHKKKRSELEKILQVVTTSISEIRTIGSEKFRDMQARGTNYQSKYSELAKQIRDICNDTSTIHSDITEKILLIEVELNGFSRQESALSLDEENEILAKLDKVLQTEKVKFDEIEGRLAS
jgi:esterase/lipase